MTSNPFGVDQIYLTKPNTQSWFMDLKNFGKQSRIVWGDSVNGVTKLSNNYWQCNDNSKVRINITTPKAASYKDTCSLDFNKAAKAGDAGMGDGWRDVEMDILVNLTEFNPSDGRVILKGPTMRHHSPGPCCSGHAYGVRFFTNTNPMEVEFLKEMWHSNYSYDQTDPIVTKFGHMDDGNDHNLKFVRYNKVEGNKTVVKLEAYVDWDADGKKFVKVAEKTDAGNWGQDGGECNGDDDQILTWGSGFMCYRWDASSTDLKYKNIAVRYIDPFLTEDTNPTDPSTGTGSRLTTTRLIIPVILCFDVNAYRLGQCAAAGGGSPPAEDPFYEIDFDNSKVKELSDSSTFDHRKIIAVRVDSSQSPFYNKLVKKFKPYLRKHNTPATNNVVAKIWKSGSGLSVQFTSPTVQTDAGLGASFGAIEYDFTTNTYILKVGDRIGVEYLGTSSSNYVEGSYKSDISGNGTLMDQYEGSSWETKSREMACLAYE